MKTKLFKDIYSYLFLIIGLSAGISYIFCFARNREFWLDEAFLGMNILMKDYFELWLPLDFKQVAPPLLLMIAKFFYQIPTGLSPEQSMRFYILLCGIGSIPLFFLVARKLIKNNLILLMTFLLFCFSSKTIYYAQEFKQYMSDTFWGLFIIWFFLHKDITGFNIKKLFFYGLLTGILLFLSYTSVFFVMAGLGMLFFEKKGITFSPFKIDTKIFKSFLFFGAGYFIPVILLLLLDICNPYHGFMNRWWDQYGAFLRNDLSNIFVSFYSFLDFFFYDGKGTWTHFNTYARILLYDIPFILWILIIWAPFLFFKQVGKKALYLSFFTILISIASYLKLYPAMERTLLYYYPLFLLIFGIYADSKLKVIAFTSRSFLLFFLLATGMNSGYVLHSYMTTRMDRVRASVYTLKEKLEPDVIPVFINHYLMYLTQIPDQQDPGAVFIFYQHLLSYTPNQVIRYPHYKNRKDTSQTCLDYIGENLENGKKYALIWEDKFPNDCFWDFGITQSFQKVGDNLYFWIQK